METSKLRVGTLTAIAAFALVASACADTFGKKGKHGKVRFCADRGYYRTKNPAKPLAPNSFATINVCGNAHGDIESASSAEPGIFHVSRYNDDSATVVTHEEGKADLKLEMSDGTNDAFTLNTDRVGRSHLRIRESAYVEEYMDPGEAIAALPDSEIPLTFERFNNDDKRLHGVPNTPWRIRGGDASTLTGEGGDFQNVLRTGSRPESIVVERSMRARLPVDVVDRLDVSHIELLVTRNGHELLQDDDTLYLDRGELITVEVVPMSSSRRFIAGSDRSDLETEVYGGDDIFTKDYGTSRGDGLHEFPLEESRSTQMKVVDRRVDNADVRFEWRNFDLVIEVSIQ